ncbi:MAG: PTS sugar transporter subunit IIA [Planctomycetaceae bacterium]|nr:PTS sugar transporter subunit IIA [Planctomycetaceae bacterium]
MSEFSKYLSHDRVDILDVKNKKGAIDGTLELLRDSPSISDFSRVVQATWQREEALTTGLGLGIGAPHVRISAVRYPTAALTVLKRGVEYGSLDNAPVRLILLVAMPEDSQAEWLRYLARASAIFRDDAMRQKLFACTSKEALWDLVKDV